MDGEEVMMSEMILPEALVEKIIAMMPFPSIFKARCLSKSWLVRFSSIPSLDVEEEKWRAASFQNEVGKWSNNWYTFCPVLCNRIHPNLGDFVSYNRASQNWSRIPSLSFLPQGLLRTDLVTRQIEGPLLYGFAHPETRMLNTEHCFVANVLTRSWRQLPPRPAALVTMVLCHKLVIDPPSETYKVILFCAQTGEGVHRYCAQIFDSKLDAWSNKNVEVSTQFTDGRITVAQINRVLYRVNFVSSSVFTDGVYTVAYLNGVFYMVAKRSPQILWAVNLEEGTMEKLTLMNDGEVLQASSVNLVVCNVDWLMLVTGQRFGGKVFRIDLGDRRLVPVATSPLKRSLQVLPSAGDGNCILFWTLDLVAKHVRKRNGTRPVRVMVYNVDEGMWTSFPVPEEATITGISLTQYSWFGSSFRPGLNPFLAV